MFEQALEMFEQNEASVQSLAVRFRNPKNKKYMLHKMVTKEQKQTLNKLKRRIKKKDPQYFSMMLKEQKKKMFVSTFIKKLKNSIILTHPPPEYKCSGEYEHQQQISSIQIPKNIQISISLFLLIQITPLLLLNSLSIIFKQIRLSQFLTGYNVFSLVIHVLQMLLKLLVQHDYQQKKKKYLKQNIRSYLYSQDFVIDCLVVICFFLELLLNACQDETNPILYVSHFGILMKIGSLLMALAHIQLVLIQNQYRAQIWNLIKVFLFNFVIAHSLTIILVSMTHLNSQKNWMINKGIMDSHWDQKYVWGYYWATTIMLTVGFGDIVPSNQGQALCMIFVETVSCIVLAYNINRVGSIISKIRSYDLQKNSNLKVFNQISQKTEIDTQIQDKIQNYIKQSVVIKRNYNIEEQKAFICKLPISFKDELLKQMNRKIWNGMIFFQNLSQKSLLELSKHLEKKLTHPEEIVYTRGHQVDVMIFNNGTFGLSYNNGSTKTNGKIIERFQVKENQYRVVSLDFLLQKRMNYDIKCIDYIIFYKISLESFLSILHNHPYDYEYYFMIKEKDKFLLNEFQIQKCQICQNQKHTMFKCPRLHYMPLRQHVVGKSKKSMKKKYLDGLKSKILKRWKISDVDSLKQRKYIKAELVKKRLQICANRSQSQRSLTQFHSQLSDSIIQNSSLKQAQIQQQFIQTNLSSNQKAYFQTAVDKLKQNLQYRLKQNIRHYPAGVWQLQCDLAYNYKFFFKQFNSQDLGKKNIKRKAKLSLS